jgi:hypothetical protein
MLQSLTMPERHWHKQVAIGTWILVGLNSVLIAAAVVAYVWPPDSAHPISLDFFSKTFTINLWIFLTLILLIPTIGVLLAVRIRPKQVISQTTLSALPVRLSLVHIPLLLILASQIQTPGFTTLPNFAPLTKTSAGSQSEFFSRNG